MNIPGLNHKVYDYFLLFLLTLYEIKWREKMSAHVSRKKDSWEPSGGTEFTPQGTDC